MRVLVVESDPSFSTPIADELGAAGHDVVRCHEPGAPTFPCSGLRTDTSCPLDGGAIDVAVAVRHEADGATLTVSDGEDGVRCILRRQVPLVVVGHGEDSPLVPFATERMSTAGFTVEMVERASTTARPDHAPVVLEALRHVLDVHGVPSHDADVAIERRAGSLRVELRPGAELTSAVREAASVRALAAIREIDPYADVINVVVAPCGPDLV